MGFGFLDFWPGNLDVGVSGLRALSAFGCWQFWLLEATLFFVGSGSATTIADVKAFPAKGHWDAFVLMMVQLTRSLLPHALNLITAAATNSRPRPLLRSIVCAFGIHM